MYVFTIICLQTNFPKGTMKLTLNLDDHLSTLSAPESRQRFNGRCYDYVPTLLTWTDAQKNCQDQGGNLVSIHSEAENNFVVNLIENANPNLGDVWIGLTDPSVEGRWSDGSALSYTKWEVNEPDGATAADTCVTTHCDLSTTWCDASCSEKHPSVCVYA